MTGTTTSQRRISVFLLDDHEAARRGLRDLLTEQADMDVVGDAATAAAAREQILALRPDVAIIDVRLPDGDGTSVCRDVRSMLPDTAVLMLMGADDDASLAGSIMAGAAGCMLKRSSGQDGGRRVADARSPRGPADHSANSRAHGRG
jgi:two-component system response regulator DevR